MAAAALLLPRVPDECNASLAGAGLATAQAPFKNARTTGSARNAAVHAG
jgi:hypothetical protein